MHVEEVMQHLESLGSASCKKIYARHGAVEPFFGVKVGDLKQIVKLVKKDHALSLDLYATGNSDAMYLAGLLADEKRISREELQAWADSATWYMVSEYTVAWVAAESPYGWELGLRWIDSPRDHISSAGWNTLSSWLTIRPDAQIDTEAVSALLDRVATHVHTQPNRTRYTMNGFVMAAGISHLPSKDKALETAQKIGTVHVEMGGTACQVPDAIAYINAAEAKGKLGHKKKMARC
jgi:hypothetical protein